MPTDERVLLALRDARNQLAQARAALDARDREPIAIIGMGCRFPGGVHGPDDLWELVTRSVDAIDEQPADRWNTADYYDPDPSVPGKIYVNRGGFLSSIDLFDAEFFGISPREAASMDPQQRLLLEVTWETMEHAGVSADSIKGSSTGIFMGLSWRDYDRIAVRDRPENLDAYAGLGNTPSIAAGRLAHVLDVNGPVTLIDTACSSSLVAVHQAVRSLRARECQTAFAGGVNLVLSPFSTIFCCKIRALSPDGRCKTFDASADGYGRAEGCGVVLLKRLSDAQRDGDTVHAVIRGSAVNHDGRTGGLTVPSRRSQESVVQLALQSADLRPNQIGYIEAHGTGTALGDPIEVGALNTVFGDADRQAPLWIGSIKTNIGHAETAAGIAGLIKTALAVRHGFIPRSLHFEQPNPHIDWQAGPVRVAATGQTWPNRARLAGVSSFGFSGTNAHVIIGEAEPAERPTEPHQALPPVLALSARTAAALSDQARRYAAALTSPEKPTLEQVCYAANTGRTTFEFRMAAHAPTAETLAAVLEAFAAETRTRDLWYGEVSRGRTVQTGLVLGHPDSPAFALNPELYHASARLREVVEQCIGVAENRLGTDFRGALFAAPPGPPAPGAEHLADTVAFTAQLAMVALLHEWGVRPAVVTGYGTGEYTAAVVAGILRIEDAIALLADATGTATGLVACTTDADALDEATALAEGQIAGRAGPEYLLAATDLLLLRRMLRARGIAVNHARDGRTVLGDAGGTPTITPSLPHVAFVSCQSGQRADHLASSPEYWARRPLWPAHMPEALAAMRHAGCTVFVEVFGGVLARCGRESTPLDGTIWVSTGTDAQDVSRCAAKLFVHGAIPDLKAFHRAGEHRVAVPTYPFQRRRHWADDVAPQDQQPYPPPAKSTQPSTATDLASPAVTATRNRRAVTRIVVGHVNRILGHADTTALDTTLPLHEVGFDSLMATELSAQLSREFGLELQAGFVFDFPSVSQQSTALITLLEKDQSPVAVSDLPLDASTTQSIDSRDLAEAELVEVAMAELAAWKKDVHD
ncbi:type I polyketide synthase [Mycobacterium haemophilum]